MRATIIGVLLLAVHTLSATLFNHLRIGGIMPNFMIMIIVSFALLRGSNEGMIIGVVAGFLQDISFGLSIGSTIIVYGIIGYSCGKFNRNFYRENFIIPFICTLFSTLFYGLWRTMGFTMKGKINFLFFLKSVIIPELIYTITLSLVIYQLTYLINEKIELHEKKSRNLF